MQKPLMTLAATAVALVLALPAAAQDEANAETVVATVNGKDITLGHLIIVRTALPEQYQQLPDDVLWDGILEQLIQQEVMAQDPTAADTKRVTLALENERRQLLAAEVVAKLAVEAASEDALRAAYQAQYVDAEQPMEFNASHILVETEDEAKALVESLNGGADFAELAKEKSTGPSGPNGGALGWFGPGMMVPPFQEAVEAMEPGTISGPVQTQFGWHVIRLNETRQTEAPAFDEVREQLISEVQEKAVSQRIESLLGAAEITKTTAADTDPSLLNKVELLED
ncbi:peptidylprolyl isomerase [Thalassococcus sp. CAU 1522]|uniref:peptidylprolyl isomerase n=1 Tax=Thalassococcus arenae TaxID=2851652 RepID=A0ABS6N6J6_9RHOB|nr:peptidylprolyl isomerase [Thalassococcus arenae]MBV2359644.1 peptidylprolyl isomerase [Thalassococcus arenae]